MCHLGANADTIVGSHVIVNVDNVVAEEDAWSALDAADKFLARKREVS